MVIIVRANGGRKNRAPSAVLEWAGAVCATASAGFGLWVAVFYDGVVPGLVPFAAAAGCGAAVAVIGTARFDVRLVGLGMALQVASPTGFAWSASLAVGVCGLVVLGCQAMCARAGRG